MGRDSDKRKGKRHHSHHSRRDDSDSEEDDSSTSSSDYDSDTSSSWESSDTSTSEEERRRRARKKARRASEGEGRRRSKTKKKLKKRTSVKGSIKGKEKKTKKTLKTDIVEISMDDYFLRSAEFRTWLSKERGVFFSDLSSEESRKLFKKFVGKWNGGILDKSYYEGIQSSAVGHSAQSNYQWQISSKVSSSDLKAVRENVSTWSSAKDNFDFGSSSASAYSAGSRTNHPSIGPNPSTSEATRVIGPSRDPKYGADRGGDSFEREGKREAERAHFRRERKELQKQQELMLDEMLPKATGRDARVEKKKVRAEKRREREYSPDFNDSKVYGTSTTIRDKVKARQEQRENKAHAAVQKISDYHAKEKARVEAIMQMAKANKKEGALW